MTTIIESGSHVWADHPAPPAERDLLSLAKSPFSELIEAFEGSPPEGPGEHVPDRAIQIAKLVVADSVKIIRLGTPEEISDAGVTIANSIMINTREEQYRGGYANNKARRLVSGASVVLGASSLHSSGYELNMLRPNTEGELPSAARALQLIYTPDKEGALTYLDRGITGSELQKALGLEAGYRGLVIRHLISQGLVHEIPWPAEGEYRYYPNIKKMELPHVKELLHSINRFVAE